MRLSFASLVASTLLATFAGLSTASCSDRDNPSFSKPPESAEAGPDEEVGPDGSPPTVKGDPTKGILLEGTVIGESGPYEGQVLTLPNGTIACAEPGTACSEDPQAAGVAHVVVNGIIAPGLIDTHNHILFDIFDDSDWLPQRPYQNHDDWTEDANEPRYTVMVDVKQCLSDASQGKPTWCPAKYDGAGSLECEMEKWGELKAMIAGTTSVVGLAGTAYPCFASLSRSIDTQFNGLDADKVQTAAITPSKATADGVCNNYASGKTAAYLIHVGEGLDQKARDEFAKLGAATTTPECLYAPQTAITHGTSFTETEFGKMAEHQMKLTWSPASNVALYGDTTNIPMALDAGITVSLAPDWSMGGSQNMLDEMHFAKTWSDEHWNGRLSAKDVVTMSTVNAAIVLGLADKLGTIKAGMLADVFVVSADDAARKAPYDTLVASTPKNVRLTMIGGRVVYGDSELRAIASGGSLCEDFDACGSSKFMCVAEPGKTDNKLGQTYAEIKGALEAALTEMDTLRPEGIGGNFSPLASVVACK